MTFDSLWLKIPTACLDYEHKVLQLYVASQSGQQKKEAWIFYADQ